MTKPIKKLTQKYEGNGFASSGSSLSNVIDTVNQIIDHIQPIPPTDTKEGDWIEKIWSNQPIYKAPASEPYTTFTYLQFRQAIESFMPKPVEQITQNYNKEKPPVEGDTITIYGKTFYCLDKPVEQELIPLLPRDIVAITDEIMTLDELGKVDEDRIHKILSKYGVPKQEESFEEKFGKLHGTPKRCNCTPLTATEAQVIQREREHELIQAYEKGIKDVSDKKFTKQYVREKMSDFLNMSRLTYASIESGKRELKKSELEKLAHIFETSVENLLSAPKEKETITSDHPLYKMIQTILYILSKCAGKPNVGKIVLNKLLYFSDFNHYEKYWTSITNDVYVKMPMGPVPKSIDGVAALMEKASYIRTIETPYHGYQQIRYIPNISPDLSLFKATEIAEIDTVIEKYGDKTGKWLTDFSHEDTPWKTTESLGDEISYNLAHYRTSLYSVSDKECDD